MLDAALEASDRAGIKSSFFIREQIEEVKEDSNTKRYRVFADAPGYFSFFGFEIVLIDGVLYMKNMTASNGTEGRGIPRAMWYWLSKRFQMRIYSSTINSHKAKYKPDFLLDGERGGKRIWEKFKEDEHRVGFDEVQERFYLDPEL